MNYVILARVIASLFLIAATYIATVSIPYKDQEINKENNEIEKFKDNRVLGAISMLHADSLSMKKRIDLFEANLNSDRERQVELRQQALERTITQIRNWASFFSKGDESDTFVNAENKISTIISNKKLSVEKKIENAEIIMNEVFNSARVRLENAHKIRNEHIEKKEQLDNKRSFLNNWFVRLQILGLILLSSVEIFDKLRKGNNT